MIRKAVSLLLAFVMCALALCVGSFAADSDNAVAGEVPRAAFSLAEGVDVAFYRLGASSRYGAARFSVLTFDAGRDDLLLDVSRGLSAIRAPEGMRAIGAVQAAATDSASFAMDRGAISCADGVSFAFGVSASGEALVGRLSATVDIVDRDSAASVSAGAVNCGGDAAVYTADRATDAPIGSFRAAIACETDSLLVPGVPVEGRVTSVAVPGEKLDLDGAAIAIAAKDGALARFTPCDRVTVTADVADRRGNTAAWRTVREAVGGSVILIENGEASDSTDRLDAPGVIGVRPDGTAAILSFNADSKHGVGAADLAALCAQLGMSDAFVVDEGFAAALLVPDGGDAAQAPGDLPDIEKQIASPLWIMKHLKLEPAKDALQAIPTDPSGDRGTQSAPEARAVDAAERVKDGYEPINALFKQIEFDSTGEWLTLVINESDLEAWYGKIY